MGNAAIAAAVVQAGALVELLRDGEVCGGED